MLLDMKKAHYANDNHDPWISLAAATARLLGTSKITMDSNSNTEISSGSFFLARKRSEIFGSSIFPDEGNPFFPARLDTLDARPSISRHSPIPLILSGGGLTEIAQAVVVTVSIDVIDKSFRPSSVNKEPRDPMSHISLLSVTDFDVMMAVTASNTAGHASWAYCSFPEEQPAIGVVFQDAHQLVADVHRSQPYEQEKEHRDGQPHAGRTDETKAREHRQAVDHGLRNIAKWEQRIVNGRMRVKRR
jgi:hypothetical protein